MMMPPDAKNGEAIGGLDDTEMKVEAIVSQA